MKKNIHWIMFLIIFSYKINLLASEKFFAWSKKIVPFINQQSDNLQQSFIYPLIQYHNHIVFKTFSMIMDTKKSIKSLSPFIKIHKGNIEYSDKEMYKKIDNNDYAKEMSDDYDYPTILNMFNYDELAQQISHVRCVFVALPYLELAQTYNTLHNTDHSPETVFNKLFEHVYYLPNNNQLNDIARLKKCFSYLLEHNNNFFLECFDTSLMNNEEIVSHLYQSTNVLSKEFAFALEYKNNIPYFSLTHQKFPQNIVSKHIIVKDNFIELFFKNFFEQKEINL